MTNLAQLVNQIIILRTGYAQPYQNGIISQESDKPLHLTFKAEQHTSAMVALFLPASVGRLFEMSGEEALDPSEYHLTLGYLGKADNLTPKQINAAHDLMRLIADNHPPLIGAINGCGRFCNGDEGGDPFFIIPDLAALPNLREVVNDGLRANDIKPANDHGFTPHITLAYIPHDAPNPFDQIEKTPVTFPTISLVLGNDRYDYPFVAEAVPISKAALIQKIGSRHTASEREAIQKMHDLALDLGAECHPLRRKAGARHSHADQRLVQRMHDDCVGLGATCKALPVDEVYSRQVMKDGEIIKAQSDAPHYAPASTPQRCKNCKHFLGDPGRDWCELFDFTADQDYVCDDWVAQRPDEIPGYVANKADLARLVEGVLVLRGGATSGNWGHAGRKGKRGGSGRGGGFGRIGVKPGASRKKVKQAAKKKTVKAKPQSKVAAKKQVTKPKPPPAKEKPKTEPKKPTAKKRVAKEDKVPKTDKTAAGDVKDAKSTNHKQMSAAHEGWHKNMSAAELDGLQEYQSSEFQNINGSLRGQKKATASNKKAIRNIDKALARSPLKEDTVVFRSMDEQTLKNLLGPDMKKWTGKGYTDKGYTSTSVKPGGGFRGMSMEIRVPKGTPSGYLGNLPGGGIIAAGEQELLLGKGQKFRILKVKGGSRPKIIAEIVSE